MFETQFKVVDRPANMPKLREHSRQAAVRETLTTGKAVAIPLNGAPYAVVRSRIAGSIYRLAKELGASLRTCRSSDGASLLVWLEPKA